MFISTHEWGELANKGWDVLFLILINVGWFVCLFVCLFVSFFLSFFLSFFILCIYVCIYSFIHYSWIFYIFIKKNVFFFMLFYRNHNIG